METLEILWKIGRVAVPVALFCWQWIQIRILKKNVARLRRLLDHSDQLAAGLGRVAAVAVVGLVGLWARTNRLARAEQKKETSQAKADSKLAKNMAAAEQKHEGSANDCPKNPHTTLEDNG